jgi:hypothetical protein
MEQTKLQWFRPAKDARKPAPGRREGGRPQRVHNGVTEGRSS